MAGGYTPVVQGTGRGGLLHENSASQANCARAPCKTRARHTPSEFVSSDGTVCTGRVDATIVLAVHGRYSPVCVLARRSALMRGWKPKSRAAASCLKKSWGFGISSKGGNLNENGNDGNPRKFEKSGWTASFIDSVCPAHAEF